MLGPVCLPVLAAGLLAAAGYWPTQRLAGPEGVRSMLAAVTIVLAVVYATLLPAMRKMAVVEPAARFKLALKAGAQRFILTLAVAGAIALTGALPLTGFLVWVALAYVVMIKAETAALLWWMRRLENRPC